MVVDDFKTPLSLKGIMWIKDKQEIFTVKLPHKSDALNVFTEHSTQTLETMHSSLQSMKLPPKSTTDYDTSFNS